MITWESLDPEAQRHWLALAEAKHGMPVTWNDVEPARREGLLETVKAELCPDRWEDETPERKQELLAIIDKDDEQTVKREHESIADHHRRSRSRLHSRGSGLESPLPSPSAQVRAGAAHARGDNRGGGFGSSSSLPATLSRSVTRLPRKAKAVHAPRQLFSEFSLREALDKSLKKGREKPPTVKSLREMLSKARELPAISDMLDGKTTPQECKELLRAYETFLSGLIPVKQDDTAK